MGQGWPNFRGIYMLKMYTSEGKEFNVDPSQVAIFEQQGCTRTPKAVKKAVPKKEAPKIKEAEPKEQPEDEVEDPPWISK